MNLLSRSTLGSRSVFKMLSGRDTHGWELTLEAGRGTRIGSEPAAIR
jgi:hypothetical protein